MDNFALASCITLVEGREAPGRDAHVPVILRGGALYDPALSLLLPRPAAQRHPVASLSAACLRL